MAVTYSPSRSNTNFSRSSFRRPGSTASSGTRRTSTSSAVPSALAQSPIVRQRVAEVTTPTEERSSMRIVRSSTRNSLIDRRTLDEKRTSYIRKRASAQSPFFSAGGARISSSSYKPPPAFLHDIPSSPASAFSPFRRNTIVRPDDDCPEGKGKELPDTLRLVQQSSSPVQETPTRKFPGSLRGIRTTRHHTSVTMRHDRVEKSHPRPGTAVSSSARMGRRASTRNSLQADSLEASLNHLTGSEVYTDADMSDSVYSAKEETIEKAEMLNTVKQGDFVLPPLEYDTKRRSKRSSVEKQKYTSKRDSRRELKRTSERQ